MADTAEMAALETEIVELVKRVTNLETELKAYRERTSNLEKHVADLVKAASPLIRR